MRRYVVFFAMLLLPLIALAAVNLGELSASDVGLDAVDLADTPLSSAIPMDLRTNQDPAKIHYNQLTLLIDVDTGTAEDGGPALSSQLTVRCKVGQLENGSDAAWATICYKPDTPGDPAACQVDLRKYTLSGDVRLKSEWQINGRYVFCELDDPDDGAGIATVTVRRGLM